MSDPLVALLQGLRALILLLRPAVFAAGALTAAAALASWAVRTRRLQPFAPLARFVRDRVDPKLFAPMERRLVRAGGTPAAAPWWTLALVVVGGLVFLSALEFVHDQLYLLFVGSRAGGARGLLQVLVRWTFSFLQLAIFARVIASWVGGSPYSKWWRWAFVVSEPILRPLRQVLPTLGPIDISPLVAYFGLGLLQGVVLRAL
jgi:YggT family protein